MYEIDVMFPVIERAEELTGRRYGADPVDDVRFRVVADHMRSSMMLISDGITPGNEARGYVLRRLLRRAVRSMRLLGCEDRVLPELMPVSRDKMGETYTELLRDWDRISTVAYAEEDAFRQTLRSGTQIFDLAATEATEKKQTQLSGDKAFALHDTYGFPIDLTLEMAAERGLTVDEPEFRRLMTEQRDRAKADARAKKGQHKDASAYRAIADTLGKPVEFTGYDEVVSEGQVRGIVAESGAVESAREGDEIELVLDRTPFYAEGGGQLADEGVIELDNGARVRVRDVQSPITGLIVHQATVVAGEVTIGSSVRSLGRPRAAPLDLAIAHRHAHGAQGVPRGPRGDRDPGGLGELPGPVPLRLLRDRRGPALGDGRRRGAGQRRRDRRPGRARRGDDPVRGDQGRGDGPVR